jgi:hypothetical protein
MASIISGSSPAPEISFGTRKMLLGLRKRKKADVTRSKEDVSGAVRMRSDTAAM